MSFDEHDEILNEASKLFEAGKYSKAESLLNQLILQGNKRPEIFHMLGTIFYDKGKFNKAIHSFRRALEINPAFTDASVGLSIILNDLGRYEEGRKIFEDAQTILKEQSAQDDPYINEKLSIKHDELGELYFQYQRHKEALDQYYKALSLSTRKPEIKFKIAKCYLTMGEVDKGIRELKEIIREYPKFIGPRIQLGKLYYETGEIPEAVAQWETALQHNPKNTEAKQLLSKAQAADLTHLNELI